MGEDFFEPGGVYRHESGGTPDGSGAEVFVVAHVGRAPDGFDDHPHAGATAFGWRRLVTGPGGAGRPLGPYVCHDPALWRPVPDEEIGPLLGSTIPDLAWPAPNRRTRQPPQCPPRPPHP
ncbi:hypothetical protein BX265_7063 [Streptomyces sp. TLI_235]|nr:hypothetical protein [Streptomyces sp. TLI_235]PBC69717.1 hypothetical protein BX265_7063 [Streptomyces sp. TLI_235]